MVWLLELKGIGGEFGCISTAIPLLSKPSEATVVSEETRKLMGRFNEDIKLQHVKVCSLLSLSISDLISVMQPDVLNLQHISQCLRQAASPHNAASHTCIRFLRVDLLFHAASFMVRCSNGPHTVALASAPAMPQ